MRSRTGCWPCSGGTGSRGRSCAGCCCRWPWHACCRPGGEDPIGPRLASDETADLRKGRVTACLSPKHAGVTRKVENCVTWALTALVTALGQAWTDFDVYMPECCARLRPPPEGQHPGGPGVRHQAGTGHQSGEAPDGRPGAPWRLPTKFNDRCGEFRGTLRALSLSYLVIIPLRLPGVYKPMN